MCQPYTISNFETQFWEANFTTLPTNRSLSAILRESKRMPKEKNGPENKENKFKKQQKADF